MLLRNSKPYFRIPRFEERVDLRPRKYINGQFQPGQKFQFQSGDLGPVVIGSVFTPTYVGLALPTGSGSVLTATGAAIGAAVADRLVLVSASYLNGGVSITSASIAGVGSTIICQCQGTNRNVAWFSSLVPSGTTGTIIANGSGSLSTGATFAVYHLTGYISATAHDFDAPAGGGTSTRSATLDSPASGCIFAAGANVTADADSVWTHISEQWDDDVGSGGFITNSGALTGQVVQATNVRAIAAVSFG